MPRQIRVLRPGSALAAILALTVLPAAAQSTVSPSADWNGNYGFSSSADRNLRLLQSDLIKKAEEGYYESLGKVELNTYNDASTTNNIGQQTTAIGVVNSSTNTIDVAGSSGVNVGTENTAASSGCQDGRVHIDSGLAGPDASACN